MDSESSEPQNVVSDRENNGDIASEQTTLCVDYVELVKKQLQEIASLKSKIYDLQRKNTDIEVQLRTTQSDLKDTQALLGQAVVLASKKDITSPSLYGKSIVVKTPNKRARSPSSELFETATKKIRGKKKQLELPPAQPASPEKKAQLANNARLVAGGQKKTPGSASKSNVITNSQSQELKNQVTSTPSMENKSVLNASPTVDDLHPSPAREQRQRKASRKVIESRGQ